MSYLSVTLSAMMREKGIRGAHLAKQTGVDEATISRILNDQQKSISDHDLAVICEAISDERREQAQLIAARMRDVQTGPAANLIHLTIDDAPAPYGFSDSPGERPLPGNLEKAIANIRRNITDPDLKNIILALGQMYRSESDDDGSYNKPPAKKKAS